jgi:pilus assembly protein Flp/PilA
MLAFASGSTGEKLTVRGHSETDRKGVSKMRTSVARFVKDESGATAIEYGLIAAGIAVAVITAMTTLSGALTSLFSGIAGKLTIS